MDRQSLEALFVGRDDLMEDVLSRVTKSILGAEKHYVLLVGPRGSGKTHFLALAHHRLTDRFSTASAHASVAVARLKEDEWGVASFLDFVVRILRALAIHAPELNAEIAAVCNGFSKDPAEAEAGALARLRKHIRGKTLLLLCENLVDLFDWLGDEGQKRLRSTIQEDGNWAIVASTPSLFSAVTSQGSPFYGFFTIRTLENIDFETSLDLLIKKAIHERKAALADFLRTPLGRARARALHHLVTGNCRAYAVLFDFLSKEALDDLAQPLLQMVDDLTPYYQDRIRQLAPAQRKIVEFLCLERRSRTIKDISTPCLMSQQTAAKQMAEFDAAGLVTRTRVGRNTYCELSEPLMRVCIEAKGNRTQYFRLFIHLLRSWFSNQDIDGRTVGNAPNGGLGPGPLPCGSLLSHLLAAQTTATAESLPAVFVKLGPAFRTFDFKNDEDRHIEAIVGILVVSLRSFGLLHFSQGLIELRNLLACRLEDRIGLILTGLLKTNIHGLTGELADWERELEGLNASLYGMPTCRIPFDMLQAAVRYSKTDDKRHLLRLPLEQRQLLLRLPKIGTHSNPSSSRRRRGNMVL